MKQANPHLAARQAQETALLPQVVQLARDGLSYQKIADQVGLAKSTVCQWLRGRPLEQAAKTLGTPRMTAKLAKRYESMYKRRCGSGIAPGPIGKSERLSAAPAPVAPAKSAGTAASSAPLVNAGTANSPRRRRKPFVFKKFGLLDGEFPTVFRSPTLPNDLAQKVGMRTAESKSREPRMTRITRMTKLPGLQRIEGDDE